MRVVVVVVIILVVAIVHLTTIAHCQREPRSQATRAARDATQSPCLAPMGFNRWALPQDMLDTETMKLTMVHNNWSLPVFMDVLFVGKLADMDLNDAMSSKSMAALHETTIVQALLLFMMLRRAPQLRVAKPDIMKLFGDLMLDKNIAAILNKCNMTPSSRLAEYFATKVMLLAICMRQTSRRPDRLQYVKDKASVDDEIKFSIF